MNEGPVIQDNGDLAATADYLAAMSANLAQLARRNGLDTLGYLFDMARLEAENVTGKKAKHRD